MVSRPTESHTRLIPPDSLLPDWASIPLHASLKRALLASGFDKPTDIQKRSLQHGLTNRDIVGVAETVRHTSSTFVSY